MGCQDCFDFPLILINNYKNKSRVLINTLKMSYDCIEYEDYKRIIQKQTLSPRPNIFQENRTLAQELQKTKEENKNLNAKILHFRNICTSIIDAIGRVFSQELASQLQKIMEGCEESDQASMMSQTIFEALVTHQSQPSASDWSQSRRSEIKTPQKISQSANRELLSYRQQSFKGSSELSPSLSSRRRLSRSPISSSALENSIKFNDPSTNRSNNITPTIATGINCEICQQTFGPNQFIQHASRCKESLNSNEESIRMSINTDQNSSSSSQVLREIDLEDTQDRKLKKQSDNYMKMMKSLIMIQGQIEQQIQLIKFSKDKIDRDTEKRKLEKDLAKVLYVIDQKKKQVDKDRQKNKNNGKMTKMTKKNSIKLKN